MKEVYLYATLGELKKISDGLDYLYESPTDPDDEFYMNNWRQKQKRCFQEALRMFGCKKIIIRTARSTDAWIDSELNHKNYPGGYIRYDSISGYITQNSVSTNPGLALILEFDTITNAKIISNSELYPNLQDNSIAIFTNYNDVTQYNAVWNEDRDPCLFRGNEEESVDTFKVSFTNPGFRKTMDNEIINANEFLYLNLERATSHTIVVTHSGTAQQKITLDGEHIVDEEKYTYLRIAEPLDEGTITYIKLNNETYYINPTGYLNSALMMPSNFAYRFDNSDLDSPMLDNVMEREEHERYRSNIEDKEAENKGLGNTSQNLNTIKRFGIQGNAINCLQNIAGALERDKKSGQFYDKFDINKYNYLNTELKSNICIGYSNKNPIFFNDEYFLSSNTIYRKNKKDIVIISDYPNITEIKRVNTIKPRIAVGDVPVAIYGENAQYEIDIETKLLNSSVETEIIHLSKDFTIPYPTNWIEDSYGGTYSLPRPRYNKLRINYSFEVPKGCGVHDDPIEPEIKFHCLYNTTYYQGDIKPVWMGFEVALKNVKYYKGSLIEEGSTYNLFNREDTDVFSPHDLNLPVDKGFYDLKTANKIDISTMPLQYRNNIPNFYKDSHYLCCWWLYTTEVSNWTNYVFFDINNYGIENSYTRCCYLVKGE